ncbi:MAG: hypothetical protein FWF01_04600, partial [Alphaproteobacteria bacterium]|nr:hypothetical protein [Alphaproteobacteria bacterium]
MIGNKTILTEVTPKSCQCGSCSNCPAIFLGSDGNYYLIGELVDASAMGVDKRLSEKEVLIKVPARLIDDKA